MPAEIEYKASVLRDLGRIGDQQAKRIVAKLEKALGDDPNAGTPLKGEFIGLRRLRVGDYRVIYVKTRKGVLVLRIGHRSAVYR